MANRNRLTKLLVASLFVLGLSSVAMSQTADNSKPQQGGSALNPWKYHPMDRAVGAGGPAPKRDITGTWAGPGSGAECSAWYKRAGTHSASSHSLGPAVVRS